MRQRDSQDQPFTRRVLSEWECRVRGIGDSLDTTCGWVASGKSIEALGRHLSTLGTPVTSEALMSMLHSAYGQDVVTDRLATARRAFDVSLAAKEVF